MDFQLPEIPKFLGVGYGLAGIIVAALLISKSRRSNYDTIPTVGSSSWLGSVWAGITYVVNAKKVIQEGYEKHGSLPFKVAALFNWIVIVTSPDHVKELLIASEDDLSHRQNLNDQFHVQHLLPPEMIKNTYHLVVLRSQFTRNIGMMCSVMKDEAVAAFDDILDLNDNEWRNVLTLEAMQKVVCRTSNRAFVGLPLCRDADWIDLNVKFTVNFFTTGVMLGLFPAFLRPLVARLSRGVHRGFARGVKHVRPMVEERLECLRNGKEVPNDLLSWLIKEADVTFTVESLSIRILTINMAAIFTTSSSLSRALIHLAANPQYVQPLREEVETIIEKEGWTKVALARMTKIDSFLKEGERLGGFVIVDMARKAMRDYTFADGTLIPKGMIVRVGIDAIHFDDGLYENAQAFEPFRFVDTSKAKNRFVSTGTDCLSFGYGIHACPGRFFAANELKCLFAHAVVTYDVKLCDGTLPLTSLGTVDPKARILFRRRMD